jgi:predicted amidohydrolase
VGEQAVSVTWYNRRPPIKPFDLIIRGGDAILPGRGRTACDIAIRDGKIARILAPGEAAMATDEIVARGLVVMPGAVDPICISVMARTSRGHVRRSMPTKRPPPPGAASPPSFPI